MSAPVSGKTTFTSTGTKSVYVGIPFNEVWFFAGPRDAVTETTALYAAGHADANKQFCHTLPASEVSQNKAMRLKDGSGTVVLEFTVTGGYGTNFINFNVTAADGLHPFELVASE